MSIVGVVTGLLIVAVVFVVCWFLADMAIPQSEIDKIDAIGRWAKKELDCREAEQKGYTCNDCYLSMQNCHDISICCEDETGLCDWFEEIVDEEVEHE